MFKHKLVLEKIGHPLHGNVLVFTCKHCPKYLTIDRTTLFNVLVKKKPFPNTQDLGVWAVCRREKK